jgi:two-component system, NarL family, invasion response regulator UvrY
MSKIHFVIVDDHEQVRRALKEFIEQNPLFVVIAEAADGETAIKLTLELTPHILIVDVNMKPVNGFMVAKAVSLSNPLVKIIGFSVHDDPVYAKRMLSAGASGYVTKTTPFDELNFALEEIIRGNTYICEEIRRKME